MDVRILQTFVVAAATENFHQTAERLFLAQPTVTQHIRLLERELGMELFERVGRRVRLTPAGKRYLPHAKALLEQWHKGIEDLLAWRQGYQETLKIAVSPIVARSFLPPLVRRYTRTFPEVDLSVRIAESVEIGPLVQTGEADLGLSRMIPGEFHLSTWVIQYDPVVFVVPIEGEDIDAPLPDWEEELATKRLLVNNHPGYWDDLLLLLRQRGLPIRTMVVSQVDITKRFIEEGLGVSFLPRSAVSRELFENRLFELPTPGLSLPEAATYLVAPKGSVSPAAQRWIDMLLDLHPPLQHIN